MFLALDVLKQTVMFWVKGVMFWLRGSHLGNKGS